MWGKPERAKQTSILWLTERLHQSYYNGSIQVYPAGVKSRLLVTSIDSKHTTVMHSAYTNRRGVEKSLGLNSLQPSTENFQAPATPPKHLSSPSSPIGKTPLILESQSENFLFIDHTRPVVALNYSLSRHTEYVQQIICEKFTIRCPIIWTLWNTLVIQHFSYI